MPKAPKPSISSLPGSSAPHPNVLKRNQACHQCRRRKMKCDAKRPCSTCVRSHAHATLHASPGTVLPPHPDCTFDAVVETTVPTNESPKTRYERLENRINELMTLLMEKEKAEAGSATLSPAPSSKSPEATHLMPAAPSPIVAHNTNTNIVPSLPNFQDPGTTAGGATLINRPTSHPNMSAPMSNSLVPVSQLSPMASEMGVVWPSWPPGLPEPDLLRHLVDVFFVFHPHANRLLHAATFMSTLSLPPTHPKFPAAPVLHAICAMGSLYTAAVTSPPLPNFDQVDADEIFQAKIRLRENRPDSFAEQQAKLAQQTADHLESVGECMFQVLQARVMLSWFYWSHSRWQEVFVSSCRTLRIGTTLALNICPPFHSISNAVRPFSILPSARTVIEDEVRRNTFWLMYAIERHHGSGNGWPLCLDDEDVSQLLPVRGDLYEQGVLVAPRERQWAHSRNLLLHHPENQTDSFILYIKGTILHSQVKTFNLRFRARHFAGDKSVLNPNNFSNMQKPTDPSQNVDPRGSQAFMELDHIISSFSSSFPSHLKNPIQGNIVDNHLYTACLMPHVSAIILHDPHADVRRSGCISALKILTGARAVLDLIYGICSTSFDISLLDPFCVFCWFISGRVLVRFLRAALDTDAHDQSITFRGEIEFIQMALGKIGERVPLAYRFSKLLGDLLLNRCGPPSHSTDGRVYQNVGNANGDASMDDSMMMNLGRQDTTMSNAGQHSVPLFPTGSGM